MTTGPATPDPNYVARVRDANTRLADTILQRWPLPRREADSLAAVVRQVGNDLSVPLFQKKKYPVALNSDGRFVVHLEIGFQVTRQGVPGLLDQKVLSEVHAIVRRSGAWSPIGAQALVLQSSAAYRSLVPLAKPSHDFLSVLKLHRMPEDPVVQACLAAAERQEDQVL